MKKYTILILLMTLMVSNSPAADGTDTVCGNSVDAKNLAELIIKDPQQQRDQLVCDSELVRIAEVKAAYLLKNQVISNRMNSLSPNQLLREYGYPIPESYAHDGNQVESVAGGIKDANEMLIAFKKNTLNRMHIFGEDESLKLQNKIGVAYLKDINTSHEDYWVVLIAKDFPDEKPKPKYVFDNSAFIESLKKKKKKKKTKKSMYERRVKESKGAPKLHD